MNDREILLDADRAKATVDTLEQKRLLELHAACVEDHQRSLAEFERRSLPVR